MASRTAGTSRPTLHRVAATGSSERRQARTACRSAELPTDPDRGRSNDAADREADRLRHLTAVRRRERSHPRVHPSRGHRTPTDPGPALRHRGTTSPPLRTEADGPPVRPRCSGTALRCRTIHARGPGILSRGLWPLAVGLWSLASRLWPLASGLWPPPCTRQDSNPQPSDPRLQPDRSATAIPDRYEILGSHGPARAVACCRGTTLLYPYADSVVLALRRRLPR